MADILAQSADRMKVLKVAVNAAEQAGRYFRERFDTVKEVKTKSSLSDLVTDVDPTCERMIRECISNTFPSHHILGEEETAPGSEAATQAVADVHQRPHLWVVDPLDGTTNFVYQIPLSVVSIGYAENGVVEVGVVYDPYRDEVFFAIRGQGAWRTSVKGLEPLLNRGDSLLESPMSLLNELEATGILRRLQVSKETDLERCVVASGFPPRGISDKVTVGIAEFLMARVKNYRALGAAALHLAYVASGRIDAFFEYDLNAWDLAAGTCIIEEAGGFVTEMDGTPYRLSTRNVVACGRQEVVKAIREAIARAEGIES